MNLYVRWLFHRYSVCVTGAKGTGKDLLTGNIIARNPRKYSSNIDYTKDSRYIPLNFKDLDLNGNTRRDFVNGTVKPYKSPYPDGTDVYISDVGVYFPSQYCNELNKEYPYLSLMECLSRHIWKGRIHLNCQNFSRIYDKLREHSDIFIRCNWCIYIPFVNFVIQKITIYDRAQSCQDRVRPPRIRSRGLIKDKNAETTREIYLDKHFNTYGMIKPKILLYFNRAKYDTRHFKKLLEGES